MPITPAGLKGSKRGRGVLKTDSKRNLQNEESNGRIMVRKWLELDGSMPKEVWRRW
jgi:hypothetical protein